MRFVVATHSYLLLVTVNQQLDITDTVILDTGYFDGADVFRDGTIVIQDPHETKALPVAGPYTLNWCLFDAVQRLPREKTQPLGFTLIDHFDEPKADCTLAFRKRMDVAVAGGRTIATYSYDQLGRGNVPWVYWVDDRGRLLFVAAGLEAYALESSKQV